MKFKRLLPIGSIILFALLGCNDTSVIDEPGVNVASVTPDDSALGQFSDQDLIENTVSPILGRTTVVYQPNIGINWQVQLTGRLNTSYDAELYVVDLFDTTEATIRALQANGRRAICFFNAGVVESWRPDAYRFTSSDTGNVRAGWEQQRWIDIRSPNVHNIMRDRLTLAQQKGCDGVAPATSDSYNEATGFQLSYNHGLMYNRGFIYESHARGLAIGMVNNREQIPDLNSQYEFALGDQCFAEGDCDRLAAFIDSGKPVLNAEYRTDLIENFASAQAFCRNSNLRRFSTLILPSTLDDQFRHNCLDGDGTTNVEFTASLSNAESQESAAPVAQSQSVTNDYRLVFSEDFRDYSLDPSKWNTSYRWGSHWIINGEQQFYVDQLATPGFGFNPFEFDGEHLTISAVRTPDWLRSSANNQPYLSGALTTFNKFSMTHGYVEMRARLPRGRGLWSAFWMLHQHENGRRPEIDVVEYLGHQPNMIYNTYHWYEGGNGRSSPSMEVPGPDYSGDFHTYGVRWEPGRIDWFVDGELRSSLPSSEVSSEPMYLLVNLAVGGWWPGNPDGNTQFPAQMTIDYIRAWQR